MEYLKRILQKNKQTQSKYNVKIYRLNVILFLILSFGTIAYCLQVNARMNQAYEIAESERFLKDLRNENQRLVYESVTIQSIKLVMERALILGLVEAGDIEYVTNPASFVAKR